MKKVFEVETPGWHGCIVIWLLLTGVFATMTAYVMAEENRLTDNTILDYSIVAGVAVFFLVVLILFGRATGPATLECTDEKLIYRFMGKGWEMDIDKIWKVSYTLVVKEYVRSTDRYAEVKIMSGENSADFMEKHFSSQLIFASQIDDCIAGKCEGVTAMEIYNWVAERRPEAAFGYEKNKDFNE